MLFAAAPDFTNITPSYKCGTPQAPSICYATDPKTDQLFRSVQQKINFYANRAGFPLIQADGKIGDQTVSALKKIAAYLYSAPSTAATAVGLTTASLTKDTVAQSASRVLTLLQAGIDILQLPPVSSPAPIATTGGGTPTAPDDLPPPPMLRSTKWKKIALGVGIVGVAGGLWWWSQNR